MNIKVTYFCLLLYVTALTKPIVPLINYTLNQDYINEFLCINKDKPKLNCNGKCFLAKQIHKQNESDKNNTPKVSKENYVIGILTPFSSSIQKIENYILNYSTYQPKIYTYKGVYNFFHPPI
ncbi:hypothetical protein KO500_04180 [Cellulophaga baltica]|uniref:hypothetical protein n=1 Tax=Cellulophaga TaxID=104264 RepID=UPI001C06F57D|nr:MULTISPECIES: hypothetical protein [Cellulophaga]MBU2995613.1 hypothetical protein [Cellulophaga baltica]MDO6767007.1 hypothetical protein [Cellulophaga sp. 1_MG-2023]